MSLQIIATDKHSGVILSYTAKDLPSDLSINKTTGLISGVIGNITSAVGSFQSTITVSDGTYSNKFAINWIVLSKSFLINSIVCFQGPRAAAPNAIPPLPEEFSNAINPLIETKLPVPDPMKVTWTSLVTTYKGWGIIPHTSKKMQSGEVKFYFALVPGVPGIPIAQSKGRVESVEATVIIGYEHSGKIDLTGGAGVFSFGIGIAEKTTGGIERKFTFKTNTKVSAIAYRVQLVAVLYNKAGKVVSWWWEKGLLEPTYVVKESNK